MYEIGNQIKNSIQNIEGVADLNVEQQVERPQLKIEPKREMLAKYGVTLPQFADIVNVMLGGEAVSQVYEENKSFDLTLKVNDSSRENAERIRKLIVDANGRKVSLENIANVVSSMGPNTISRENVARKLVISANVADRDLRGVVNDIQKKSIVKSSYRKDITLNMADNLKVSRLLHASSLLPPYFLYWSSSCSYSRNSKVRPSHW